MQLIPNFQRDNICSEMQDTVWYASILSWVVLPFWEVIRGVKNKNFMSRKLCRSIWWKRKIYSSPLNIGTPLIYKPPQSFYWFLLVRSDRFLLYFPVPFPSSEHSSYKLQALNNDAYERSRFRIKGEWDSSSWIASCNSPFQRWITTKHHFKSKIQGICSFLRFNLKFRPCLDY